MYNPDTANTINYEEAEIPSTQPPEATVDTETHIEQLSLPGKVFAIGQSLANLREEKLNYEVESEY